jgi:hypothetical protein
VHKRSAPCRRAPPRPQRCHGGPCTIRATDTPQRRERRLHQRRNGIQYLATTPLSAEFTCFVSTFVGVSNVKKACLGDPVRCVRSKVAERIRTRRVRKFGRDGFAGGSCRSPGGRWLGDRCPPSRRRRPLHPSPGALPVISQCPAGWPMTTRSLIVSCCRCDPANGVARHIPARIPCPPLCKVAAMPEATGSGFPWKSHTAEFTNPTRYQPGERGWVKIKNRQHWRWELEREISDQQPASATIRLTPLLRREATLPGPSAHVRRETRNGCRSPRRDP